MSLCNCCVTAVVIIELDTLVKYHTEMFMIYSVFIGLKTILQESQWQRGKR